MSARLVPSLALALCLTAVCLGGTARADELTPAKKADIRLLLDVSGSGQVGRQLAATITQQLVQTLRQTRPDISTRALAIVERETAAVIIETVDAPGGMLDRMVPLYAGTFTHQEIRELLAFYESPVGKKSVAALPGLMRAGQKIGENMSREIGPELKRRLITALSQEGVVLDRLP